ncbi:MAG: GNAT family N-acetyltransferase [Opitutaceae bacterium]
MEIGATAGGGWYGLGPRPVLPARQRRGVGSRLMEALLAELRDRGARVGVLVGDPGFCRRLGFVARCVPDGGGRAPEYCLGLRLRPGAEVGAAKFHAAFAL